MMTAFAGRGYFEQEKLSMSFPKVALGLFGVMANILTDIIR